MEGRDVALPPTRMQFDVTLSNAERGLDVARSLVVSRHPSETLEHVALRVLAWCALYDEALEPGPGLCDGEAPDLVARNARGETTMWVACGRVPWEKIKKALSQNADARVIAFFCDDRRARELDEELEHLAKVPKGVSRVEAWAVDADLVRALALDARRQSWTVTIVDGHAYVDAAGATHEGEVHRRALPIETAGK
jgi:uncharacterized protein YaeQ